MKKIFYTLLFGLGFFFALTQAKQIKASKCTINEVTYDLPKTIGFVNSYTLTEYTELDFVEELPSSFSSNITMIVLENRSSCESINNYEYYFTSKSYHQLNQVSYTYHNIIVDTLNGSTWSYSGSLPSFQKIHKSYISTYTDIFQTVEMYY